ncbi:unnamed protein product [Cylindrotheca closterium]|uniref:Rubredoxin-like domain-containing protein n=1 Tax=Cylindrotheca closterium TaxID=2856 RepID=A0AAD2FEE5_9STRA|nr:unnamed protein product [Cylindrotheca closterium]
MKSFLAIILVAFLSFVSPSAAFTTPSISEASNIRTVSTTTSLAFGPFGQPKDDGSPGDYLCKDCGYVFTKGPKAWAALDDKYKCPPCGAPKFRFKKIPKGSADGKVEVKKSWF